MHMCVNQPEWMDMLTQQTNWGLWTSAVYMMFYLTFIVQELCTSMALCRVKLWFDIRATLKLSGLKILHQTDEFSRIFLKSLRDNKIIPDPLSNHTRDSRVYKCGDTRQGLTHLPWTKCPPLLRRYFQRHFREWKFYILIKISLKFVPKGLINNNPALF